MAKITRDKVYEQDLFNNLKESAKQAETKVDTLVASLEILKQLTSKLKTDLNVVNPNTTKGLKELNALSDKALLISNEKIKLDNQLIKAETKLAAVTREKATELAKVRLQQQQLNKEVKQAAKDELNLGNAYEKGKNRLSNLKKEIKNLTFVEGQNSAKVRELKKEYISLNSKVRGAEEGVGEFQRTVGNYPKGLKGAIGSLKNFASQLGIVAGVAGLARAIKSTINVYSDFEQSNAKLSAILGKTREEITALTLDAKRLGGITSFTASQVSELQTEFAKLGFNEQEILNATEATLDLAAATGSELAESAAIAGATLGGFGLEADETQRVVDVMAKSFSTSALDLEKFKESMKGAAPAAKAVGIDVEKTTALLGTLANAGISGSKAGNNLKTSLINLNNAGLTLEQGLEKVANSQDKLGEASKLVGKNAAASFLVLAEGVEVTKELEAGLDSAGGSAKEMADKQLDTLQGSVKLLQSAWESLVLEFYEGNGALSGLKNALVFVAKNLKSIFTVIGLVTKAFISFKVVMFSLKMSDRVKEWKAYRSEVKKGGDAMKGATTKTKAFGKALKGIGLGLAITALIEMAIAFYDIASGAAEARRQQDLFNKSTEVSTDLGKKFNKIVDDTIKKKRQELDLLVAKGEISQKEADIKLKNLEIVKQQEALKVVEKSKEKIDLIKLEIKALEQKIKLNKVDSSLYGKTIAEQDRYANAIDKANRKNNEIRKGIKELNDEIVQENAHITEFNRIADDTSDTIHDYTVNIADNSNKLSNNTKEVKDNKDAQNEANKILKDKISLMKAIRDLEQSEQTGFETEASDNILTSGSVQETNASTTGEFDFSQIRENYETLRQLKVNEANDDADFRSELARLEIKDKALLNVELERIEVERLQSVKNINKETEKEQDASLNNLIDLVEQYNSKVGKITEADRLKRLQSIDKLAKASSDAFIDRIDKRIAKIQEESDAAQKQADLFEQLAINGNIQAQQSLAKQNEIIAQNTLEKEKLERRKQLIEIGTGVTLAYTAALSEKGTTPAEALVKAFSGSSAIQGFISLLPTFFEGTENTGKGGEGIDGRGGFHAILHPFERVVDRKTNALIGDDISNTELGNIMQSYRLGEFNQNVIEYKTVTGANVDFTALETKMDVLTKAVIENKPPDLQIEKLTSLSMEIRETSKKNGITTTNRFVVN